MVLRRVPGIDRETGNAAVVAGRFGSGRAIRLRLDRGLIALVACFVMLATAYNVIIPVFEAPDEPQHFYFAQHLAQARRLPVQTLDEASRGPWEQEGSQPPLYYALSAPLVLLARSDLAPDGLWTNDQNTMGHPALVGNENRYIHPPVREGWPWHGYALGAHLVRGLSTLLGALTVVFLVSIARRVLPGRPALALAVAVLVAFNPQFLALSAAITNDNLIVLLATAALALLLRVADGDEDRLTVWALALTVGLAPLAKISGLAVAAFAAATVTALAWRRRDARFLVRIATPMVVALVLLSGWWYLRNQVLYGDATGLSHMLPPSLRRDFVADRWLRGLPGELTGLWYSSWGLFGWFTVMMPSWFYAVVTAGASVGLAGLVVTAIRRPGWLSGPRLIWLGTWAALLFASLLRWLTVAKGAHGRLLFPAIVTLGVVLVAGWRALLPDRVSDRALTGAATVAMGVLALYALVGVIRPAYAWPAAIEPDEVPTSAVPAGVVFDDRIVLLAVEAPDRVTEGETFPVTMYWRVLMPITRDGLVAVRIDQSVDTDGMKSDGRLSEETVPGDVQLGYPGSGAAPPRVLGGGVVWVDRRVVVAPRLARRIPTLPAEVEAPGLPVEARLSVHLYDGETHASWTARIPSRPSAGAAGDWGTGMAIDPRERLDLRTDGPGSPTPVAHWENGIRLVRGRLILLDSKPAYATLATTGSLGQGVTSELWGTWLVDRAVAEDLRLFVHLIDPSGRQVATFDRAPATQGTYPTSRWRAGDVLQCEPPWQIPYTATPGEGYRVVFGLYRPSDGSRIAAFRPDGTRWPDDAVVVWEGEVR
jgi:hypothetical protein